MKHLCNIYDPDRSDAKQRTEAMWDKSPKEIWEQQERYLADKIIGPPKATEHYTVEELRAMGIVGVYTADAES